MASFFRKIPAFLSFRKNRNRRKRETRRAPFDGRGGQSGFISRSATLERKRTGFLQGLRDRLFRRVPPRERQFRTEEKGGGLRRFFIPVVMLVVAVLVAYVAFPPIVKAVSGLSLLKIREIAVSGCRVTNPTMIRELAGIHYQTSLLQLDVRHAEAVLRAHSWIAEAHLTREWPDGLTVAVREFVADAILVREVSGLRQLYYLDREGNAFALVEAGQDMDLPVVTGLEVEQEGEDRTALLRDTLSFLKYVRQNNPNLPAQNLSEIHVDRETGMTVYLADHPFPIYFGAGEIRTKYSRLKRVLETLYKETEQGKTMADIACIRMDYQENKVLVVAHSGPG